MNTPEGNKRGGITVRRRLANGLSIVALGVSSAMGVGGCSGIKEGKTYPQETQTQSAQGEMTEQNTIMTPSRPTEGDYTPEQMERIQNGEFSDQESALENWTRYWGAAEDGPFRPETKDLHYKYLFGGEGNCFVLLEAGGEGREGRLFALPIMGGVFMAVPPEIPGEEFEIPEGFGPLTLSGSVAYRDGGLVRLDENGKVSERLNLETARWEEERFRVLVPETLDGAMENNRIYFENFQGDFSKYIGKIKEGLDESENGSEYSTSIFSGSVGAPGGWGLSIDGAEMKGVASLVMPNGDELVLLTYLLGRDDYGPERALVTLCVDPEATKNYLEGTSLSDGWKALANLEENYPRIIGQKSDVEAVMIYAFGEGEGGGNWANLYDVFEAQPALHTSIEPHLRGLHLRFLSPAMQELENRSKQALEIEKTVIPVVYVSFPIRP